MEQNAPMDAVAATLAPSVTAMFDDLVWWSRALSPARAADQARAA